MNAMEKLFRARNPKPFDSNFDKPYADFKEFWRKAEVKRVEEDFDMFPERFRLLYYANRGEDMLEIVYNYKDAEFEELALVKDEEEIALTKWQKDFIEAEVEQARIEHIEYYGLNEPGMDYEYW